MENENTDITGQIKGCSFPQWYFEQGNKQGAWTPEEVAAVEAPLRKAMQDYYDTGFGYATNYWRVWKSVWSDGAQFTAVKATWESGSYGGKTAEEIAAKIEEYYTKK